MSPKCTTLFLLFLVIPGNLTVVHLCLYCAVSDIILFFPTAALSKVDENVPGICLASIITLLISVNIFYKIYSCSVMASPRFGIGWSPFIWPNTAGDMSSLASKCVHMISMLCFLFTVVKSNNYTNTFHFYSDIIKHSAATENVSLLRLQKSLPPIMPSMYNACIGVGT